MKQLLKGLLIGAAVWIGLQPQAKAQETYKSSVEQDGQKVLVGRINEKILANDSAFAWFYSGVNKYNPDPKMIKYISAYRDSFNVVVFAGTWCPDTHRLLPQFYRVMLASSYPADRIQLYGVDRNNKALDGEAAKYKLEKTPTFIILRHGREVGRIVESVHRNMESDIVALLDKMVAEEQGSGN